MKKLNKITFLATTLLLISTELIECMKALPTPRQTTKDKMNYELLNAIYTGKEDIVSDLLSKGANPNARSPKNWKIEWTPLHYVALNGNQKIARELMKYKPDLDAQAQDGDTPLNIAILNNNQEIIHLLLAAGANPKIQNNKGKTAIDLAKQQGMHKLEQLMKGSKKIKY